MNFNKQTALKIVNPLLGLSFVFQMATGILAGHAGDWYETVMKAHDFNAWFMCALVALHLWLNWSWIKANVFKRAAKKAE